MFERCFVVTACEAGIKKYGSLMAFAKKIWPEKEEKAAAQTLYAILDKSSKTGKPQRLKLDEAVMIVDLLDYPSFASFCFDIGEKLRVGWNALDHMGSEEKNLKRKNPKGKKILNGFLGGKNFIKNVDETSNL